MRFSYPEQGEWADQFVHRPLGTELLEMPGVGRIILEKHPVFDRVMAAIPYREKGRLMLEQAACRRALARGRRFFTFSTVADHAAALRASCGLGGTPGFITLIPAAEEMPRNNEQWRVESGDRM
jgi:hypothetical protein